jgi:AcrR family transcriptional regulator
MAQLDDLYARPVSQVRLDGGIGESLVVSGAVPDLGDHEATFHRVSTVGTEPGGHEPTMAEAAEAAGVHRATAYRYFPTAASLLADASLTAGMPDIDESLKHVPSDDPIAVMDAGVLAVSRYMFNEEAIFRNIVRVTVDRWFEATKQRDPVAVRETRRFLYIDRALEPLAGSLSPDALRLLRNGLALVYGAEALIVTRDVCRPGVEEATEVMRWAAKSLIREAVAAAEPVKPASRPPKSAERRQPSRGAKGGSRSEKGRSTVAAGPVPPAKDPDDRRSRSER